MREVAVRNLLNSLGPAPKVAILRGGGLGDFLVTTPALRALRAALPDATLVLLTTAYLDPLARRYAAIDRVVLVPPCAGVTDGVPNADVLAAFVEAMREECFDLALQWVGGGQHSNAFVRRLGARLTAGFRAHGAAPLDYWLPYDPRQHEVLRYLDLLRLLGAEPQGTALELPLVPSDYTELAALDDVLDLERWRRGELIGVNLGAGAPTRRWAPEQYAAVINALGEEREIAGVVVDAPEDQRPAAARFVNALKRPAQAIDLAGRTSLGALIALISRYRLFLTNDSGPAHMANALGTPTVVVFGSANPLNWAPLNRTWQRVVADWGTPCRYLADDGCAGDSYSPCLQGVTVDAVLQEARGLLDQREALGDAGRRGRGLLRLVSAP
ncbi:MAG TPA: glycosyltransferase family 9 protein [Chloroflexota bacterium]|nr:glycosyltransferase family 9 protein [Chloroflexota bacterium]